MLPIASSPATRCCRRVLPSGASDSAESRESAPDSVKLVPEYRRLETAPTTESGFTRKLLAGHRFPKELEPDSAKLVPGYRRLETAPTTESGFTRKLLAGHKFPED